MNGARSMRRQHRALGLSEPRIGHPPRAPTDDEVAPVRCHGMIQADFRCRPAAGFFAGASLAAAFLPAIGIGVPF